MVQINVLVQNSLNGLWLLTLWWLHTVLKYLFFLKIYRYLTQLECLDGVFMAFLTCANVNTCFKHTVVVTMVPLLTSPSCNGLNNKIKAASAVTVTVARQLWNQSSRIKKNKACWCPLLRLSIHTRHTLVTQKSWDYMDRLH